MCELERKTKNIIAEGWDGTRNLQAQLAVYRRFTNITNPSTGALLQAFMPGKSRRCLSFIELLAAPLGHTAWFVFQDNAHFFELFADSVCAGKILCFLGGIAVGDHCLNLDFGLCRVICWI